MIITTTTHPQTGIMCFVSLRGRRSEAHTDLLFRDPSALIGFDGSRDPMTSSSGPFPSLSDRFAAWVDFDGFVSALGLALRGALPLRAFEFEDNSEFGLRDVPPPSREAELSTWQVPRSSPSVGLRWHGIVQHRQRKPTSVRRKPTSEFESVSLSWLLYVTIYVVLPLLPTFLDPPWFLMSSHPARFDQPVLPSRMLVDLHLLNGKTSTFKNCLLGGSLLSILPALSP